MTMQAPIQLAPGLALPPRALTRHIGIFGSTGTGKTNTAAAIVAGLACPVLILDAKGDLAKAGTALQPWNHAQLDFSAMGAPLIARALDLSGPQAGALEMLLGWAADHGRPVASLSDLSAVIDQADLSAYGYASSVTIGAIKRAIFGLRRHAPWAFGARRLGKLGGVSVLQCCDLAAVPGLYSAFVADLLSRLYAGLGELGDVGAPGLVVMIDEAHLVFSDAPPGLVREIARVVRLIRSKGVGLIWVTQAPGDLPGEILGQLGTRIQHGLRAATVAGLNEAKAAALTMPGTWTAQDVLRLGIGAAIVATLDQPGARYQISRAPIQWATGIPVAPVFSDAVFSDVVARPPRPWYFWPMIIAALIYGPMIVATVVKY